jgi:FkbM family methyltransferase
MSMTGVDFLKRVTYRPEVKALAKALGLRKTLRDLYFHCARPSNGIVQHQFRGVAGQFHVRTPGELRNLDPAGRAQQEERILELLLGSAQEGDVVFDVGANVGLYTILLAKAVGQQGEVIAFEPNPESYDHLQDNITLNAVRNVKAFRVALGETNGEAWLYGGQENGDSSLVSPPLGKDLGRRVVEIAGGDSFRKAKKLPVPGVVKIDVEGYEYHVLQGLRHTLARSECRLLCCEVHSHLLPKEIDSERILDFVRSLGFGRLDTYDRYDTFHLLGWKATSCPH